LHDTVKNLIGCPLAGRDNDTGVQRYLQRYRTLTVFHSACDTKQKKRRKKKRRKKAEERKVLKSRVERSTCRGGQIQ
jgi:hypothetical protein